MSNNAGMSVFARLVKVDEAKRQLVGVVCNEAVDHAGEVFDYATSAPHFKAWSDTVAKASNGLSVGNLRAQHGSVVAGKLDELVLDDVAKAVSVVANVVDDNEWKKVLAGCYTGFSVGGKYEKKWDDTALGKKRYTAVPSEISLVDLPCNPDASFVVHKSDGSDELRKYAVAPAADPALVKSIDDAVVAGIDIEALRKEAARLLGEGEQYEQLSKFINDCLDDANKKLNVQSPEQVKEQNQRMLKCYGEALAKRAAAKDENVLVLLTSAQSFSKDEELKKGLYDATRICDLLCTLGWVTDSVATEAMFENDGSGVPAQLVGVMRQLGQALIALVQEEVAEMLSNYAGDAMKTTPEGDLKKDAGNASPADNETLMKGIEGALQKALAPIAEQSTALTKSLDTLSKTVAEQGKQLDELRKNTPAGGGPRLHAVDKGTELRKDAQTQGQEVAPVIGAGGKQDDAATLIKSIHANGGQDFIKPRA